MEEIVDRFDTAKRQQEVRLFKEIKKSYQTIEKELLREAERILADLPQGVSRNAQHRNVMALLNHVEKTIQGFADSSLIPRIADGMVQASYLGEDQSVAILKSIFPETVRVATLPVRTIDAFTRQLTTGPLGDLFHSFGKTAALRAQNDMLLGITLGHNPRKLARTLRQSLGVSQTRAFLIARTETMRAHREGTRQSYKANNHLVSKWVWHASASRRTCAACWAMHGSEHDLDEEMNAHPACRCTMVPKPKTWKQMGYDIDEVTTIPQGEDLFAQQSEDTQRAVLGPQYSRYKNGDITLRDFVQVRPTKYGNTITKKVPR